ncbi:uncharacterized protein LOC107639078 isoform X1 [Arachis ipaensis]|uniref:uncharacterized protein LOC107639078 isoform X1 n=2 Tax=Arachis ipaensis TaxID=130454 RepID=UPI0007AF5E7B|nr:uncharacterized protein LOC107639078 isoform X1 [Arachis ipaensis]XP_016197981.1 uncharacterized protein LOC107639078 isoform X1 [Arachis ipaensis]XP_020976592.1 uncharacterized protein LOC107639078 isoform X1 [Arachis ipaensis]XP_020976593.1 uncharacterized protein LOC107639078 isoform X1 [Arachis ipaensis]XP_025646666.1 uncharacterized protein LOC112741781 isoform X1 [Arachis hypogaea]XP_025646667.1 uncharacterized protein LOC112741781 isoform X1 [Arachis hypogaea]XP_025646668.1 uncharac
MFSQREDGDSKHSPAFCKGVGVLNRSSRRRGTSNRVRRSLSKFGFSEPPLTVRPWSHNQSDSTRSCARQETPSHTKSLPCQTDVDPGLFVARTGSSCALAAKDCSPIALSVVTSVSGLNKEIRRLTKCICRHNEVVADFRKALTTLAKIQNMEQQCDHGRRFRCPCWSGIPSKRRLRTEDFEADDPIAQETDRSQHHDPSYAPTLDGKFIMDHMPFRSKKLKRAPRTRQTARDKSQTKKNPNMVDLTGERGRQSGHPRRPRSKSPGRSNCIQKHYNYLAPVGSDGAVHESALLCMVADKIPKAFNLAFVPTRSMDLAGVELAVATYIFSKDLPKSEILADVGHCVADRTALLTLGPNERVMDDVITIVATMLSKTSSQHQWFMPTMIMQDALQGTSMTQANIDAVVSKHMRCKVDKVTEIFQPMWTDGH